MSEIKAHEVKRKTGGLLDRFEGNMIPKESYVSNPPPATPVPVNSKKDARASIKLPKSLKSEIEALRVYSRKQYDYEIIQMLVDSYVGTLGATEYRKYQNLREML